MDRIRAADLQATRVFVALQPNGEVLVPTDEVLRFFQMSMRQTFSADENWQARRSRKCFYGSDLRMTSPTETSQVRCRAWKTFRKMPELREPY